MSLKVTSLFLKYLLENNYLRKRIDAQVQELERAEGRLEKAEERVKEAEQRLEEIMEKYRQVQNQMAECSC